MMKRKSKTVGIHLNDAEYSLLLGRVEASGTRSMGSYIKAVVFNAEVPTRKKVRHVQVADPNLIRHLAWIGNNINQIARSANQSRDLSSVDAASLFAVLAEVADSLESLQQVNSP